MLLRAVSRAFCLSTPDSLSTSCSAALAMSRLLWSTMGVSLARPPIAIHESACTIFVLGNKAETSCLLHLFFYRPIRHGDRMLTRSDNRGGEARLRYLDADVQVLAPGDFVVCAVTGRKIPLQALRYWSVDR
ncbi:DUF2093 domain-containing protein, partial [Hyphomonas johnsonii]|uniref:DUF2093 domain-containing protein n=1 Tax=Hyphomonas johnsonii TaxID=81031 RepID=UPI0030CA2543